MKTTCENCGKSFDKPNKDIKRSVHNYCSRSCAAQTNNAKYPKRTKKFYHCKFCNALTINPLFCNHEHWTLYERDVYIRRWLLGKETGHTGKLAQISNHVRIYLLEKVHNKCEQCGWSKINSITKLVPLQIHHKDGNHTHTTHDNLIVLCPNCHALTGTFGRLNKTGRGRRLLMSQEKQWK